LQKKYGEPTGQALLESAMRHIDILDRLDFHEFKVCKSIKCVFNYGCLSFAFSTN
jgi:(E)-4-hydroxy-3-methylbut-2-enyl-diphosphate synthase